MCNGFEIIDHTADVAIAAYGNDVKQAFANAALGMFSLMIDIGKIKEMTSLTVTATADDRKDLLVAWLNELIYTFEVERMLFKRFEIETLEDTKLKAECYGEKIDLRHKLKMEIKAATYHMLQIEEKPGRTRVQVLFDI